MANLKNALRAPLRLIKGNKPSVTLIPLSGAIGAGARAGRGLSANGIDAPLKKAFNDKNAKAVVLAINSPGGAPAQARMIMQRIRHLADESGLPVISYIEDVGASGGYMIAVAGDEIWADPFGLVGSIGVVSSGFGFHDAIEKLGIERRVHHAGANKVRLDPFRPETAEDAVKIEKILNETHQLFIDMVKTRRGGRINEDDPSVFSGDFFLAEEAKELGLIDGVGDLRTLLQERYGKDVEIKPISTKKAGLLGLLGSSFAEGAVASLLSISRSEGWSRRWGR